jgi:hypothetical protein
MVVTSEKIGGVGEASNTIGTVLVKWGCGDGLSLVIFWRSHLVWIVKHYASRKAKILVLHCTEKTVIANAANGRHR